MSTENLYFKNITGKWKLQIAIAVISLLVLNMRLT